MRKVMAPMMVAVSFAVYLAACAHQVRSEAHSTLRIASWNLEHLAESDGSGCKPRTESDYAALRAMVGRLDADVIAFQEVESMNAAARVFDPTHYAIFIEDRAGSDARLGCRGLEGQFLNRQAVGFAVRRDLIVERHSDVSALQLGDPNLRSGVDITIANAAGEPLRLLVVHLKSGCSAGQSNEACPTLFAQIPLLEDWIDARANAGERFAVLGDFNRRLALAQDQIWADLDDGAPTDLSLAAGDAGAGCDPRYPAFIDHIIVPAPPQGVVQNFREWIYDDAHLSDHCPVSIDAGR